MKTLIVILLSSICTMAMSQGMTYEALEKATIRPQGKFTWYVSKSGEVFSVGDRIFIGLPSNKLFFSYIEEGDNIMMAKSPLPASAGGEQSEIKFIDIYGLKRTGFYVNLRTKGHFFNYNIQLENAIESGEVVTSIMTSDQALTELKKAKDKLDLGLITQMEYDSIKAKLAVIIK